MGFAFSPLIDQPVFAPIPVRTFRLDAGFQDLVDCPRTTLRADRLAALQQSLDKDPDNALTHYHLGMAYAKAGEDSKAIVELKKALTLDPKLSTADEARRTLKELQI